MQWLPCSAACNDETVTTARFGHSAVCISGQGSVWGTDLVVVFGGVSYSGDEASMDHHAALSDVVVLQPEADMWFAPQVSAAIAGDGFPEARAFHCAAAVDRRMYVFGGHVLSYDRDLNKKRRHFFNDMWCLDTDTWTWQRLEPGPAPGLGASAAPEPSQPSRRDMATLTRAGSSCLLLFGGRLENGRIAGDAWVLDLNSCTWSQLKIPGPTPPPRKMHAAVYATNRVVLFGGERDTGVLDDLWTLKGADGSEAAKWTQIRLRPAPSGRFGHSMTACGSRLAVFGGCLDQSSLLSFSRNYVQCNELWVLDMATFSWHRVEGPEGVPNVSGPPLTDPNLIVLLQQLAEQQCLRQQGQGQQGQGQGQQLLLLPAERMCHSLVPVGAGRLLLLGGRRRDGICDEPGWWLSMGPDNLTPSLIVPPPDVVAAALIGIQQAPKRPSTTGAATAAGGAAAVQQPASQQPRAPPPLATTSAPSLLGSLLSRKSVSAASNPGSTPLQAAAHGGNVPGPTAPAPSKQQQQQQLQQQYDKLAGHTSETTASGGGGGAGGGRGFGSVSSYGSALDAAAVSSLVPVPSSPLPIPTASASAAAPGPGPAPGRGLSFSRSTGAIQESSELHAAAGMGAVNNSTATATVSTSGNGGKERMADKASTALTRITTRVATLLAPGRESRGLGAGPGPDVQAAPPAAAGSVRQAAAPPPPPIVVAPVMPMSPQASGALSSGGGGTAVGLPWKGSTGGAAGALRSPLTPDVQAAWEQLRNRMGLPPQGGPQRVPEPPKPVEPLTALAALGHHLAPAAPAAPAAAGTSPAMAAGAPAAGGGQRLSEAAAVARARQHLACSAAEQLAVGQLPVLLADAQALLKDSSAAAWSSLEAEFRQQRLSAGGPLPPGTPPPPPPPDLAVLATYVSSRSSPLVGLRLEELRLGDVPGLLASYRSLVLAGAPGAGRGCVREAEG